MTRAANPSTAVAVQSISSDQLQALLQQSGMIAAGSGDYHRMSLVAGSLVTDAGTGKEETWPPVKNGPAMTVRIVKPPVYYNAFWLGPPRPGEEARDGSYDATGLGHPDWNGRFVKKYDDPAEQAADEFSNLEIYEAVASETGKRGSFKADIQVQIVPSDGVMTGQEPVYTLSLSTTGALDFRGTSKNPNSGVVQDKNFIVQLAEFAIERVASNGGDENAQRTAVLDAMTALRLGGVIADIYLIVANNDQSGNSWTVPAFKPVDIQLPESNPALASGEEDLTANSDDVPF